MDYPIFIVSLSEEDGGGFLGLVPDLSGCMSDGETRQEALKNTEEAIEEWLETARRRGIEIPPPGSAAARATADREHLVATLKDVIGGVDHLENRLHELEIMLRDIEDKIDHQSAWARFVDITGVQAFPVKVEANC